MIRAKVRRPEVVALCVGVQCQKRHEAGRSRLRVLAESRLCAPCRDNLAVAIKSLPTFYDECGRQLCGSDQRQVKTSGGSMPGLPFNTMAADARAAVLGFLGSWAGMVTTERKVKPPPRTVASLAEFLVKHVDWLARHVAVSDLTEETEHLVRIARRAAYPRSVRRVPVGSCVEPGCTGDLIAFVKSDEPLLPAEIVCDQDPCHLWPAHQWTQLSRRIDAVRSQDGSVPAGTRWLSAADISRLWSVPTGSVYRLASEQRWRRSNRGGRTNYLEADVHRTFSRRRARRETA